MTNRTFMTRYPTADGLFQTRKLCNGGYHIGRRYRYYLFQAIFFFHSETHHFHSDPLSALETHTYIFRKIDIFKLNFLWFWLYFSSIIKKKCLPFLPSHMEGELSQKYSAIYHDHITIETQHFQRSSSLVQKLIYIVVLQGTYNPAMIKLFCYYRLRGNKVGGCDI